jgi:hypothetical protein
LEPPRVVADAQRTADGLIAEFRSALELRRAHEEEILRRSIEQKVARLLTEDSAQQLGEAEVRAALEAAEGHYHHAMRILSANDVREEIRRIGRSKVAVMLSDVAASQSERAAEVEPWNKLCGLSVDLAAMLQYFGQDDDASIAALRDAAGNPRGLGVISLHSLLASPSLTEELCAKLKVRATLRTLSARARFRLPGFVRFCCRVGRRRGPQSRQLESSRPHSKGRPSGDSSNRRRRSALSLTSLCKPTPSACSRSSLRGITLSLCACCENRPRPAPPRMHKAGAWGLRSRDRKRGFPVGEVRVCACPARSGEREGEGGIEGRDGGREGGMDGGGGREMEAAR